MVVVVVVVVVVVEGGRGQGTGWRPPAPSSVYGPEIWFKIFDIHVLIKPGLDKEKHHLNK